MLRVVLQTGIMLSICRILLAAELLVLEDAEDGLEANKDKHLSAANAAVRQARINAWSKTAA